MRGTKTLPIVAIVVGVLLFAGAALTAFWVTPNYVGRLPDDGDYHRSYAGTFDTIIDPQAVAQGNLAGALKGNVPMAVERRVKVERTAENTALVSDERTTTAAGAPVEHTTWKYALDRRTLEPEAKHPSDWSVVDAQGLTVSFPFNSKKKTYTGWVPETARTTPVGYLRSESHAGLSTYVYSVDASPAPITDAQVLAPLPKALPQSLLKLVVSAGPLAPDVKQQLTTLLPSLGDPVPLAYTQEERDTFWVEPETGVVVDLNRHQLRLVGVKNPADGSFIGLLPVIDAEYAQTPEAVKTAVHDANKGRKAIELVGTTLPVIAAALGLVLVVVGIVLARRRPRPTQGGPVENQPENQPESPTESQS